MRWACDSRTASPSSASPFRAGGFCGDFRHGGTARACPAFCRPTPRRERTRNRDTQIGMKRGQRVTGQRAAGKPLPGRLAIVWSAVSQIERSAVQTHHLGLPVDPRTHLGGEIVAEPPIVIAREDVHLNAGVGKRRQTPQHARVTSRNDGLVLEPEIKQVAQQKEVARLALDEVEPRDQLSLAIERGQLAGHAQVQIGSEEYAASGQERPPGSADCRSGRRARARRSRPRARPRARCRCAAERAPSPPARAPSRTQSGA